MTSLRNAVPPEIARRAGAEVARRLIGLPELARPGRIALYAALAGELPTRSLFDALRQQGRTLLFPRCVGERLEFAATDRFEDLARGRYGVAEPAGPAVPLVEDDVVVVPGLAFDDLGRRLGRGGGFYDRAFPPAPAAGPFLVGVAYEFQRLERIPAGREDRAVDAVVTECGMFRCAGSARGSCSE
jgi:5-formyltetrahydrofolate cyclo-ligase